MHRSSWWTRIWKTLANQQGQIPVSDEPSLSEPEGELPAEPETGEGQPAHEETFFDPAALAPELQTQWRKMQGAYTKRMQKFSQAQEAANIVQRFNSDPEFARQTIMQRAGQLGLNIAQPGTQNGTPNGQPKNMPPELVEAVKSNLSPELQWMAPALAASQWAGMQMALQPIKEQQAQTVRSTHDQEYESMAASLSEKAPGWESHEDEMSGLLTFLQSPKMFSKQYGSKLELLHKLVSGDGQATAEAARRMGTVARSRAVAGSPMASPQPNIREQVLKPKNMQESWGNAAKYAIAEMERQGIKV